MVQEFVVTFLALIFLVVCVIRILCTQNNLERDLEYCYFLITWKYYFIKIS